MEKELFFTGYCRCLDGSRTVEVILEGGQVMEIDCAYPDCIHRSVCIIAKQVDEAAQT